MRKNNFQVLSIADFHATNTEFFFPSILFDLKTIKPQIDCLFIEYPKSIKHIIDNVASGKYIFKHPILMISNSLVASKMLGIKIHGVDNSNSRNLTQSAKTIEERNKIIAEEISNLITSRECNSGILILGSAHFSSDIKENIPALFVKNKISHLSILPTDTELHPSEQLSSPHWARKDCSPLAAPMQGELYFENSYKNQIRLLNNHGYWQDFDWSLLINREYLF